MPKTNIPIEQLLTDLHGSDKAARDNAARELGKSGDPRAVDALLLDLTAVDWKVRRNAAQALGVAKDKRAVEPLIAALQDRLITVRSRAAVALGRLKDPHAIDPLITLLMTPKGVDYDVVAPALIKIGKAASPALIHVLTVYPDKQQALLTILAGVDPKSALDPLLTALDDPNLSVRLWAAQSLRTIKSADAHAIQVLRMHLQTDGMVRNHLILTLGQWHAAEAVPDLVALLTDRELFSPREPLYRAITEAMQQIGNIPPRLFKIIFKNHQMRLIGMARRSNPKVTAQITTLIQRLHERMDEIGQPLSPQLQELLEQTNVVTITTPSVDEQALTGLLFLLNAPDPLTRTGAALALPWLVDRRALDPLRQTALDPNPNVRAAALWAVDTLERSLHNQQKLAERKKD